LEFLGRLDRQVKVRGVRIELEEIEAVLAAHPRVRSAAVLVVEGAVGKRLVGYAAGEVTAEELAEHARAKLPAAMVPAQLVVLAQLPLTPQGKVDRRALKAPERPRTEMLAPRTETEEIVAGIFAEVLKQERVGPEDNFFELGGHSLLAVQLMSKLERATGRKLPLSAIFQAPTVRGMAELLLARDFARSPSCVVPLRSKGTGRPVLFFHPVGGNLFSYRNLVRALGEERPIYGIQSVGIDGEEAPFTTVKEMAGHYVAELLKAVPEGPYHLAAWSSGGVIAYEVARQLRESGGAVASLTLIDTPVPSATDRGTGHDPMTLLHLFALDFGLSLDDIKLTWEEIGALSPHQQIAAILDLAKAAGAVLPEVEAAQIARYFEIFKANLRALEDYCPGTYAGRLLLLRPREPVPLKPVRPDAPVWRRGARWLRLLYRRSDLRLRILLSPSLGWKSWVTGGVETEVVEGSHFSVLHPPHAAALAECLRTHFSRGEVS